MNKKTQIDLVIEYCKEFGSITPAKIVNRSYRGGWFGSEITRTCRKLRQKGLLASEKDGKFEKFYLADTVIKPQVKTIKPEDYCSKCGWLMTHSPECSLNPIKKLALKKSKALF